MRQHTPFALAIGDLDHFKQLNDTHGHETGDRSLRLFAQATRRALRDVDLIGRWGGEEFVIVMPGTDAEQAVTVLERVRGQLEQTLQGQVIFTVSFGVTDSTRSSSLEELIQLADLALYKSKDAGRDRITISDELPLTVYEGGRENVGHGLHGRTFRTVGDDDPQVGGLEIV